MSLPSTEQFLYAQIAVAASILEFAGAALQNSTFKDTSVPKGLITITEHLGIIQSLMYSHFSKDTNESN